MRRRASSRTPRQAEPPMGSVRVERNAPTTWSPIVPRVLGPATLRVLRSLRSLRPGPRSS